MIAIDLEMVAKLNQNRTNNLLLNSCMHVLDIDQEPGLSNAALAREEFAGIASPIMLLPTFCVTPND